MRAGFALVSAKLNNKCQIEDNEGGLKLDNRIQGVVVAVTPFAEGSHQINFNVFADYLEFLINKNVNGFFIAGTTGEGLLLSVEERAELFAAAANTVKNRAAILAHVGDVSTDNAVNLAKHAQAVGIEAVSVVLPYFYPLDDQAIYAHFARIAASVPDVAVYAYNIPGNTVNNLSAGLYQRMAEEIPNFAGVKTSSPDLMLLKDYIYAGGAKCSVLVGCDGLDLPGLVCGAQGLVSGNSSAFPEPFVRLYAAVRRGDLDEGRRMQKCIDELRAITRDGRYLAIFKEALALRGLPVGGVRGALRGLNADELGNLKAELGAWALRWQIELK